MSQTLTSRALNRGRRISMTLVEESETRDSVWLVRVLVHGETDTMVYIRGFSKAHKHYRDLVAIWSR